MGLFRVCTAESRSGLQGAGSRARVLARWLDAWGTFDFEYELVDAGDRVVMLVDQRTRGRSSAIEVPWAKYAQVATFRDGLMVHWKMYASQSKALEDVGFSE
jgi:hypothetical protein